MSDPDPAEKSDEESDADATRKDRGSRSASRRSTPAVSQPSGPPKNAPDFGPRYRVVRVLGKGGMGEVYLAFDNQLKGEVALKVVRDETDYEGSNARFRREIALARKVTNPNVLRVYDLAEHNGLHFLSMEYVDGETLAAIMKREKQIPLDRVLAIFRQICIGLEAAHSQGVVHRDLKPQNVLLDKKDHVRVADFGLARSIGESGMTVSGAILGSPAYMSPEQVKGDPADERSDIYSLGILLYQLIAGAPPFKAASPHAVMEMRLHKPPQPIREIRLDTPMFVENLCMKCLALDPKQRFQTMAELLEAFDNNTLVHVPRPKRNPAHWYIAGAVVSALVLGVALTILLMPHKHAAPEVAPTTGSAAMNAPPTTAGDNGAIAVYVLGIENRTTDPVFDGTLDTVFVWALRQSTQLDPVGGMDLRQLASELGPDVAVDDKLGGKLAARDKLPYVNLRGSIVSERAAFTISVTAVDGNGKTKFAQALTAPSLAEVVPTVGKLATGLRTALGEAVPPADADRTGLSLSLDADHEFSLGVATARANNDPEEMRHYERAIGFDPSFALAHVNLGILYENADRVVESRKQYDLALRAIDRMSERDRLKFLGDYYAGTTEEQDRAIESYRKLLARWPRDTATASNLSIAYALHGDVDNALQVGQRAAHDHPRDIDTRSSLPRFEVEAGKLDQAIADVRQLVIDFPRPLAEVYADLAVADILSGKRDDALKAYATYRERDLSAGASADADLALAEGRLADAERILAEGIATDRDRHTAGPAEIKLVMLAELRLRRGDKAGARAAAAQVTELPARRFEAALVQIAIGDDKAAKATEAALGNEVAPIRRAMAKMLAAETLRVHGKPVQAIVELQEALHIEDHPLVHFLIGRAALDAKRYADAYSELQTTFTRRGELALAAEDLPSVRRVPPVLFYLAKAQEGLGSPDAPKSYRAFLAMMHDPDPNDPLVVAASAHAAPH